MPGDLRSIWYYHTGGFLDLLMAGRAHDATDARDKVYAVLGMAEVPLKNPERNMRMIWAGDDKRVRPFMKVEYSASISEVYQYTAKYLINRDENLDILCILPTHHDASSGDLPSWTPDWRVPLSSRPLYDNWDYISYKMGASVAAGFELPLNLDSLPHPPERPAWSAIAFEEGKHIRRLAQSTRGPSVVPSTAVVGDAIWILYGCKMPVILRPAPGIVKEKTFEVLVPCYVTTITFGEAIEWLAKGRHDLDLGWIVLV